MQPAPVMVGTPDWDGVSMFEVVGISSFSGPVELQPQGDLTMGQFTSMPGQSGNDSDMSGVGAMQGIGSTISGTGSAGAPRLNGTSGH